MSQIRTLVRDIWYTLEITEIGAIRIAARIVAAIARDSARLVPGVRVALGRSTQGRGRRARRERLPRAPSSARRRRACSAAPQSWTSPLP